MRSRRINSRLLILLASVVLAAQEPAPSTHISAHRINVTGVANFAEVNPQLYRGAQPHSNGFANLKKMGVDIVVDLRLSGKDTEKQDVTRAGMTYVSIPWHCLFPKDKDVAKFLLLLRQNKDKKIFVHCRYGDDRTGMMIAAFRMAVEGWSAEDARKEMDAFGFHHVICRSLVSYEEHLPEHLQKSDDFKAWRAAAGATTSK